MLQKKHTFCVLSGLFLCLAVTGFYGCEQKSQAVYASSQVAVQTPETEEPAAPEPLEPQDILSAANREALLHGLQAVVDAPEPCRDNTPQVLVPTAPGTEAYSNAVAAIDASNSSKGYIMAAYTGSNPKVKLQLTGPDGNTYTYTMRGGWEVFPLTAGSGSYTINIFENIGGSGYSYAMSQTINASLENEFNTYLYPNQYVNFSPGCATVAKGQELAQGAMNELDVVDAVYNYVISNITYDYNKASTVTSGYVPDVDTILNSGTGICFDYAALMATMLRTQGIPTRLDVGWAGNVYHAWVSVWTPDTGWINGIIEFTGSEWKRMDPTFACNGQQSESIMAFISNSGNYSLRFTY